MRNFHLYFIIFLCLTVIKHQVKCILFSVPCRAYTLIHYKKKVIYTFYEQMLAESRQLEQQISFLQSQPSHYPEGKFLCARNQNRCKWYLSDGHSQKYLPKKERKSAKQLLHKTISGNLVRSKSESLIDMLLYTHKIPFRYKCALQLGDITLYPNFTIRHPYTGHIFYWEHFGRMDDPTYCKNTYNKLQLYSSHRIIPSIHLITTYETQEYPLSTHTVEKVIQQYFL